MYWMARLLRSPSCCSLLRSFVVVVTLLHDHHEFLRPASVLSMMICREHVLAHLLVIGLLAALLHASQASALAPEVSSPNDYQRGTRDVALSATDMPPFQGTAI